MWNSYITDNILELVLILEIFEYSICLLHQRLLEEQAKSMTDLAVINHFYMQIPKICKGKSTRNISDFFLSLRADRSGSIKQQILIYLILNQTKLISVTKLLLFLFYLCGMQSRPRLCNFTMAAQLVGNGFDLNKISLAQHSMPWPLHYAVLHFESRVLRPEKSNYLSKSERDLFSANVSNSNSPLYIHYVPIIVNYYYFSTVYASYTCCLSSNMSFSQ